MQFLFTFPADCVVERSKLDAIEMRHAGFVRFDHYNLDERGVQFAAIGLALCVPLAIWSTIGCVRPLYM